MLNRIEHLIEEKSNLARLNASLGEKLTFYKRALEIISRKGSFESMPAIETFASRVLEGHTTAIEKASKSSGFTPEDSRTIILQPKA